MNPEELKNIWSQQNAPSAGTVRLTPEHVWQLADQNARFKRKIFWQDVHGWLGTIFIAVIFLYAAFLYDRVHWLMVAAAIIACLPMTYVAWRRLKRPAPTTTATLTDHLRDSIVSVQHELDLLRSLVWWYIGPFALSGAIALVDVWLTARVRPERRVLFFSLLLIWVLVTATFFFWDWKMKQRAARKHLEPRLRQLEEALAELER
jgi:L-asparagine transporter-like permease